MITHTHQTAIEALGLSRVDLLGFSLGGLIAQEIAITEPVFVRHVSMFLSAKDA
jgi:pimeloyl-ACP methyl ester carboxylesterase